MGKTDNYTHTVKFDIFEQIPHDAWVFLIKYIARFRCEACGAKFIDLEAHHLDKNHDNNCLANGVCVCKNCHVFFHVLMRAKQRPVSLEEVVMIDNNDINLPLSK